MESLKLPITVVGVVILQIGGFIWWTAQQAATISDLEETVKQMSSRMAIEDQVNLKRDVQANESRINDVRDDIDDIWQEINSMAMHMTSIVKLQQRMAVVESEIKFILRDHDSMGNTKGGMK